MLPVLAAGFIFGAAAVVGQKYAEKIFIPAATKFLDEARVEWDEFVKECEETRKAEAET